MQEIKIGGGTSASFKYVRAIIAGGPASGKTSFAASAPDPLFISDAAEGGYKTIESMDPNLWWDPRKAPTVWAIENGLADVPVLLARLEALKSSGKFPFKTVVLDPISIYAERILAELQMKEPGKDNRQVYGDLANHLRVLLLRFHALPCNVLWLCHVKDKGLALAGQTADKFPAYMDFKWMTNVIAIPGRPATYELHTAPFQNYTFLGGRWSVTDAAGQRWGLPDPLVPSFKVVAQIMGLAEQPVSPSVPGYPTGVAYTWPPPQQPPQQQQQPQPPAA